MSESLKEMVGSASEVIVASKPKAISYYDSQGVHTSDSKVYPDSLGEYSLPYMATFVVAPQYNQKTECAIFDFKETWKVIDDNSGYWFEKATGKEIDVPNPEFKPLGLFTRKPRPTVAHVFDKDADDWVLNSELHAELLAKELAIHKKNALLQISNQHALMLNIATGNATAEERDTWMVQENAARAYLDNSATEAQLKLLETAAQYRGGIKTEDFAKKILEKSALFAQLVGHASGLKAKAEIAIHAAKNAEDLGAAMEQIKAEAEAVLARLA